MSNKVYSDTPNKTLTHLPQYYQRTPEKQGYDQALFLAGRGLQSAELNEIQRMSEVRIQGIGDALFQEGDVVSGAHGEVNPDNGHTTIEAGKIYLQGAVRVVEGAQLVLPINNTVHLGIRVTENIITELTDPDLRDPAVGSRNYQEAGAARLQRTFQWEYQMEENPHTPASESGDNPPEINNHPSDEGIDTDHTGLFYPIYLVVNGILIQKAPPPQSEAVTQGLARYDAEAHGHYVVHGLRAQLLLPASDRATEQTVVIEEGKAHINGFEVELTHRVSATFPVDPECAVVTAEPHPFVADKGTDPPTMTLTLHHQPIAQIQSVSITQQKTLTVTHGAYAGAMDAVPEALVIRLISVTQDRSRYQPNQDYRLEAGQIDWSLGGQEPAAGSRYTVVCEVRETVRPEAVTETTLTVTNAVKNSLVLVDYTWYLPRVDVITLDQHAHLQRLKGTPHPREPVTPPIPSTVLALARLPQTGSRQTPPRLEPLAVHRVSMAALQRLQTQVSTLYQLVAQLSLSDTANQDSPAVKKGLLVDPFLTDEQRDAGVPQTAVIVDQCLTLPIDAHSVSVVDWDERDGPTLLPFEWEGVHEQALQTDRLRVNPFHSPGRVDPPPAVIQLRPPVDRWTVLPADGRQALLTQRFSALSSDCLSPATRAPRPTAETPSGLNGLATTVRPLTLSLTGSGFQPGETVTVLCNGQVMTVSDSPDIREDTAENPPRTKEEPPARGGKAMTLTADADGQITGYCRLPSALPSGHQRLQFLGDRGHQAEISYVAQAWMAAETRRVIGQAISSRHSTARVPRADPLVQTFTLEEGRHIAGLDVWVKRPTHRPLWVQLRLMRDGRIESGLLAQARVLPAEVPDPRLQQVTRFTWPPVWLLPHTEYALALSTACPSVEVACARLGHYDPHLRRRVMPADLQGGQFFEETRRQTDRALSYRLLGARFTSFTQRVTLGERTQDHPSDVMLLTQVDRVSAETGCYFSLTDKTDAERRYVLPENQPTALPTTGSGAWVCQAHLQGSARHSPVIDRGFQFVTAKRLPSADYVTRMIPAARQSTVTITYEAQLSGDGSVEAWVESAPDQFAGATLTHSRPVGEGWMERVHTLTPLNREQTRVKLVLTGGGPPHPRVRQLRVVVT